MLSRKTKDNADADGDNALWDIAGDANVCMTNLELLQFANLSLDEPQLEEQILTNGAQVEVLEEVE